MITRRENIQQLDGFLDGVIRDVIPGGRLLGESGWFFEKDHHSKTSSTCAFQALDLKLESTQRKQFH